MASIRFIRNVIINGQKSTLEIMMGSRHISDKCYARINREAELWFTPIEDSRNGVVQQGLSLLKQKLSDKEVLSQDGTPFDWE